jgi:hypothetical protein
MEEIRLGGERNMISDLPNSYATFFHWRPGRRDFLQRLREGFGCEDVPLLAFRGMMDGFSSRR